MLEAPCPCARYRQHAADGEFFDCFLIESTSVEVSRLLMCPIEIYTG